jgi:serine/threonine protein kinase
MRHEKVIFFYGIFVENNIYYMMTEYLPLGDLKNFLKKHYSTLTLEELMDMYVVE